MTDTATKPKVGDTFDPAKHATPMPGDPAPPPGAAAPPKGATPQPDAIGATDAAPNTSGRPKKAPAKKAAPARARSGGDTGPKRGPGRPSKAEQRADRLGSSLASLGLVLAVAHPADGMAVIEHSPGIADALSKLAEENPRVARFLDTATEGSAWLGVLAAISPLALTILANHGVLPPQLGALFATQGAPGADAQPTLLDALADIGA